MNTFPCIDAHTAGNPVRVVVGGAPVLEGANMFDKRQYFLAHFDWIRTGLMFEPRGHDMMSGSLLYPPIDKQNDLAVLFIETSGCLPMCGHGLIGTITVAIEHGLVTPKVIGQLKVETPAGLVRVDFSTKNNKVQSVRFTNVPSFLWQANVEVNSAPLGPLVVDIAYGGNFYAIVDMQKNFPGIDHYSSLELIAFSRELRKSLNELVFAAHPENKAINTVSHVLWAGEPKSDLASARNAVFYGEKAIDRSPCGTGTSARMAQWFAKGKLKVGDRFLHESIIGSQFNGCVEKAITIGGLPAIVPSIEGSAKVTGINTIFLEDSCPYKSGFQVI